MPPACLNQRTPTAWLTPHAAAAASFDNPVATWRQNPRSASRPRPGRPGERITGRPVTIVAQPFGRPIRTSYGALRRPVESTQFTSFAFTSVLDGHGVAISMDGRGHWIDHVSVERFWRSLKYEHVYLHAYDDLRAARCGSEGYIAYCIGRRRHASLGRRTPDRVYAGDGRGLVPVTRHVRSSGVLTQRAAA